jgi:hypothetical protein
MDRDKRIYKEVNNRSISERFRVDTPDLVPWKQTVIACTQPTVENLNLGVSTSYQTPLESA